MKTLFKVASFFDYAHRERKFVIAAVSRIDEGDKYLTLGVSCCRFGDDFDEDAGKLLAQEKAMNDHSKAIYFADSGACNYTLINALLEQEARYFMKNPGHYLKGYDAARKKYLKKQEELAYRKQMCLAERRAYGGLKNMTPQQIKRMFKFICGRK